MSIITIILLIITIILSILLIYICDREKPENFFYEKVYENGNAIVLDIPPRRMWGWGQESDAILGYCGETSVQSAGLYYGNYISQGIANIASGGSSLLLGDTENTACKELHFNFSTLPNNTIFTPESLHSFLTTNIVNNKCPVIIGIFDLIKTGDNTYDHIIILTGYDPDNKLITFNDHYLLDNSTITLDDMFKNRSNCSDNLSDTPQPLYYCIPNLQNIIKSKDTPYNYALVINGNIDPNKELFPIKLNVRNFPDVSSQLDRPDEPDWGKQDSLNMSPIPLSFKATIAGLTKGVSYTLMRYDDYTKKFDTGNNPFRTSKTNKTYSASFDFIADSDTVIIDSSKSNIVSSGIMSNKAYFFRCITA